MKLIIASSNAGKRREIAGILGDPGVEIVPPEHTRDVEVVEDGATFAANAAKKAEAFARANGLPALADDSGLAVDALDGRPGVRSARFAGVGASDAENNARLLELMRGVGARTARFICALHLAFPDGDTPLTAEGSVAGEILEQPDGEAGFGYDPLFHSPELGKSFARATPEEKASVSHRGRALRALAKKLAARLER